MTTTINTNQAVNANNQAVNANADALNVIANNTNSNNVRDFNYIPVPSTLTSFKCSPRHDLECFRIYNKYENLFLKLMQELQEELTNSCNEKELIATCEAVDNLEGDFLGASRWFSLSNNNDEEAVNNILKQYYYYYNEDFIENHYKKLLRSQANYIRLDINHLTGISNLEFSNHRDYNNYCDWGDIIEYIYNPYSGYKAYKAYELPLNVLKYFEHYAKKYEILEGEFYPKIKADRAELARKREEEQKHKKANLA